MSRLLGLGPRLRQRILRVGEPDVRRRPGPSEDIGLTSSLIITRTDPFAFEPGRVGGLYGAFDQSSIHCRSSRRRRQFHRSGSGRRRIAIGGPLLMRAASVQTHGPDAGVRPLRHHDSSAISRRTVFGAWIT